MKIGYARVSTKDQTLEPQIDALRREGCERIYEDVISGTKTSRPGYDAMLDSLRKGDTLIVWKIDRLGRTVRQLITLMDDLNKRGIAFKSITDNIDANTTAGKMMFYMLSVFADMERTLIVERTKAGIRAARARGKNGGRPKSLNESQIRMLYREYNDLTRDVSEIANDFKISVPTLYRYVRNYEKNISDDGFNYTRSKQNEQ